MSVLINVKKVAALALSLALMSSVAGQAFAFACLDAEGKGMDTAGKCAKQCDVDLNITDNLFIKLACF